MPVVQGKQSDSGRIFIQFDGNGARGNFQRCVVQGRHKLILVMFKDELFIELYDLESDPQEHVNTAFEKENVPLIELMLESLREHMEHTDDLLRDPADAYQRLVRTYAPFRT